MANGAERRRRFGAGAGLTAVLFAAAAGPALADEVPPALTQVAPELAEDVCVPPSEEVVNQELWTENALGLPRARSASSGAGVTVAVVGTGVDDSSAALSGAVDGAGEDCTGFGTFLAGIVAARPQPDSGLVGVAPGARVLAVPVTDDWGGTDADAVAEGITDAVGDGADVVLVGVAIPVGSSALEKAVDTAVQEDVLVVAPSMALVQRDAYAAVPATRSDVLGVAGTGTDGVPLVPAPPGGGVSAPDLTAPGQSVLSLAPGGDGHAVGEGDAVAAAFVAGVAAQLRSDDPELSAAQTAERLVMSAYPDAEGGAGFLDPVGALTRNLGPRSGDGAEAESFALDLPREPHRGAVMAVVGGTALLVTICAVGAAAARRLRSKAEAGAKAGAGVAPRARSVL
ncbi:S8 family serine peptidase [Nocardiopsis sp. NPDC006938]|uniref:S8 family serine peptidase n=1 Tax=Nocardiopsis sp. NPDC006938 TaxID=3364337 RepID=UPI0036A1E65C